MVLLTIGIVISLTSCKKNNTDTSQDQSIFKETTYWECNLAEFNPDTTRYFYLFSLTRNGNLLTGEVFVRDSSELKQGVISGLIGQDSIFITADFDLNKLDFSFKGVVEGESGQSSLAGSVMSGLPGAGVSKSR